MAFTIRRFHCSLAATALLAVLALPAPASAQARAAEPAGAEPLRWYGWQLLLADGAAGALAYWGSHDVNPAAYAAAGLYAVDGPIIHGLHGHAGSALRSGALRVGLPLALGLMGKALESSRGDPDVAGAGVVVGAAAGAGLAMVIDWATAWERAPAPADGSGGAATPATGAPAAALALPPARPGDWSAGVVPTRQGARLSLAVAF